MSDAPFLWRPSGVNGPLYDLRKVSSWAPHHADPGKLGVRFRHGSTAVVVVPTEAFETAMINYLASV